MIGGRQILVPGSFGRVLLLVTVALAARLAYLSLIDDVDLRSDADHYHAIATNLATGNGFSADYPQIRLHPTAFRPPLYPFVLGLAYKLVGPSVIVARVLNVVFGIAVVVLTDVVATRLGGRRAGLVAGLTAAVYVPLIANDTNVLSDPLSLILVLGLMLFLLDRRVVWAGLTMGLLVLLRPSALAVAVVVLVWIIVKMGWERALGFTALVAVLVVPWMARNAVELDAPVLVTSNGFNINALYSLEAQESGGFVDATTDERFDAYRFLQLDEVAWDTKLREHGIAGLRRHPRSVIDVVGRNVIATFELDPQMNTDAEELDGRDLTVRSWSLPLFYAVTGAGIAGLWMHRREEGTFLLMLLAGTFTVQNLLLVAPPRLRAPLDVACCIGVGLLAADAYRALSRKRSMSTTTRVTRPTATKPRSSLTDTVNVMRRPLTFSTVASAATLWPIAVGARWSSWTCIPTLVSFGPSWLARALTVASSHRAMTRGVASTSTVPDFSARAVSASVTTSSTSALRPGFTGTGVR